MPTAYGIKEQHAGDEWQRQGWNMSWDVSYLFANKAVRDKIIARLCRHNSDGPTQIIRKPVRVQVSNAKYQQLLRDDEQY